MYNLQEVNIELNSSYQIHVGGFQYNQKRNNLPIVKMKEKNWKAKLVMEL